MRIWVRTVSLLLLFTCCSAAQPAFTGLATNANGSKLWFSSRLRLNGTDSFAHAKIFTWDAALAASADPTSGFRLLEQREAKLSFPPGTVTSSTFHELVRASVSRDGAVVAITATDDCINFTFCVLSNARFRATIYQSGVATRTEPEHATLSANGQFAFLGQGGAGAKARILNLATGASTPPFDPRSTTTRLIANNGATIQANGLRLWPTGDLRSLPAENCVAINAAATRAYCVDSRRVNLLDIASGRLTTILTAQGAGAFFFDISESGVRAALEALAVKEYPCEASVRGSIPPPAGPAPLGSRQTAQGAWRLDYTVDDLNRQGEASREIRERSRRWTKPHCQETTQPDARASESCGCKRRAQD